MKLLEYNRQLNYTENKISMIPSKKLYSEYVNIKELYNYRTHITSLRVLESIVILMVSLVLAMTLLIISKNDIILKNPVLQTYPVNGKIVESVDRYIKNNSSDVLFSFNNISDYKDAYDILESWIFIRNKNEYNEEYKYYRNRIKFQSRLTISAYCILVLGCILMIYVLSDILTSNTRLLARAYNDDIKKYRVFKKWDI